MKSFTQSRQGAKTRKEELLGLLRELWDFRLCVRRLGPSGNLFTFFDYLLLSDPVRQDING